MENFLDPIIIPNDTCISFNYTRDGEMCPGSDEIDMNKLCKKCLCFYAYQIHLGIDLGFDTKKFFLSRPCNQGHVYKNMGLTLRHKTSRNCLFCYLEKIKTLPDSYVKTLIQNHLKIPKNLITEELINLKRQQLKFHRALKQLNQEARI